MAPHTWAQLGDTVSDDKYRLYYKGQRIKEAYYRGEKIWGESIDEPSLCAQFVITASSYSEDYITVRLLGDELYGVLIDPITHKKSSPFNITSGETTHIRGSNIIPEYPSTRNALLKIYGKNITSMTFKNDGAETYPGGHGILEVLTPFGKECSNITNIDELFYFQTCLKRLPKGLFKNMPNVVSANRVFTSCINLSTIPDDLFFYMPRLERVVNALGIATNRYGDWESASKQHFKLIPENLFVNNPSLIDMRYVFVNCDTLTTIPENLFINNPNVESFEGVFSGCESLTTIPENLFKNNSKVVDFDRAFFDCKSLVSIPDYLFMSVLPTMQRIEDGGLYLPSYGFYKTFEGCTSLRSIPENLFKYAIDNNLPLNFMNTFAGCSALTGAAPALWTIDYSEFYRRFPGWSYHSFETFLNCINLSNYNDIPSMWK